MKKTGILALMMVMVLFSCAKKDQVSAGTESAPPSVLNSDLSRFQRAFESDDYSGALKALRSSFETFWQKTPLLAENVKFVMNDSASFGIYTPKQNDEFSAGEIIYLYMEPVGQSLKKNAQGQYDFGFAADFSLEDENGKVLGGQKDFVNPKFTSWNFNTEIALTFNFTFSGLEKGKYKLLLLVKDIFSDKKATIEKAFSIV